MVARPTRRLSGSSWALTSVAHESSLRHPPSTWRITRGTRARALRLAAAVARLRCLARDRRRCGASWSTARAGGGRRNGGPHVCVLADRATGLGRAFRDRRVTARMALGRKAGEWPQAAVARGSRNTGYTSGAGSMRTRSLLSSGCTGHSPARRARHSPPGQRHSPRGATSRGHNGSTARGGFSRH